jgi:hypothetical protein
MLPIVFKKTQVAGRVLEVQLQSLGVRNPEDLNGAFEAARQQHPDALELLEQFQSLAGDVRRHQAHPR